MPSPRHNPTKDMAWLQQIDQQIAESRKVDSSARMKAQGWKNRANDLRELVGTDGMPNEAQLLQAATVLDSIGDALNPLATTSWKVEEVQECAERLRAFLTLGMLEDEQVEVANELIGKYAKMKTVKGSAKTYEDRPAKVTVLAADGTEITSQTGNTENSPGNITGSLVRYLEGNDITVTEETREAIRKAVRASVIDGQKLVQVGDFATIVHKA